MDAKGLAFWDAHWKRATTSLPQLRLDESAIKRTDVGGAFLAASNHFLVQSPDFLSQAHLSRFMDDEDTDEKVAALMGRRALFDIGKVEDAVAQQIRTKVQIAINEVRSRSGACRSSATCIHLLMYACVYCVTMTTAGSAGSE